jgi:Raf kinase inhibitor-like YbhB/YbcL family protein
VNRMGRRAVASAIGIGAVLPAAGCGVVGTAAAGDGAPVAMTVSSSAFTQATMIPARYTCAAGTKAINPPLGWGGTPAGTKSLALVVDDSDAPITPYVYWIVFDINPGTSEILEGQLPPGARQARNSEGTVGYDPLCPGPQGHEYRFTVYALNRVLNLPEGASLQSAWSAIASAAAITGGRGRLTASAATPASAAAVTSAMP